MVTREQLVDLARDIEKKKKDIEIMGMFCTTTWTDEEKIDFRAEYRVKKDELSRLEQNYDNLENEYANNKYGKIPKCGCLGSYKKLNSCEMMRDYEATDHYGLYKNF